MRGLSFSSGKRSFMFVSGGFSFTRQELETIMETGYLSNPDVYAIVKKIADVGSDLPLKVYQKEGDKWVIVEGSDIEEILENPNDKQTTQEFIEECLIQLLNTGNVFVHKMKAIGMEELGLPSTQSMRVLPTGMVDIQINSDWSIKSYDYQAAKTVSYLPDEIIHIKYIDPTECGKQNHYGLSPLQAALITLDGSNNSHFASAHILKNKGISGLLSTEGEVASNPKIAKAVQDAIQRQLSGAGNFGGVPVSSIPMKYTQVGMSPTDLKILELNIQRLRTFCNVYGTDSSLFNDPENKTYNNRAEATKDFYTGAVLPALGKVLTGLNKDLVQQEDTEIRADTSGVPALQKDKKAEAETQAIYVSNGILTANEVRDTMGYDPLPEPPQPNTNGNEEE